MEVGVSYFRGGWTQAVRQSCLGAPRPCPHVLRDRVRGKPAAAPGSPPPRHSGNRPGAGVHWLARVPCSFLSQYPDWGRGLTTRIGQGRDSALPLEPDHCPPPGLDGGGDSLKRSLGLAGTCSPRPPPRAGDDHVGVPECWHSPGWGLPARGLGFHSEGVGVA